MSGGSLLSLITTDTTARLSSSDCQLAQTDAGGRLARAPYGEDGNRGPRTGR